MTSVKALFAAYGVSLGFLLLLIIVIINWTSYHEHYLERLENYQRAELYLRQDVCSNDRIKAQLGDYTNCERSGRILEQSVRWLALADCARDIARWLGFSGAHFTDTHMFKLCILGVCIVILGVWLGVFRFSANREIMFAMQPTLPTHCSYDTSYMGKKKTG